MLKQDISFLLHDQIDRDLWDNCIKNAFNGLAYAESWYLDIVSPGWCALVQGNYNRVMPLPVKKKYGINYIIQPLFTQQLGVFSTQQMDSSVIEDFLISIPSKYLFTHINLNTHNHLLNPLRNNLNHELDLIDSYDEIKSRYSANLKRNIKKAEKTSLTAVKHVRPEEVIRLFRNDRGREVKSWGEDQYRLLLKLLYTGMHKNRMDTYGVLSSRNEIISAAVFLKSRKSLVFLFSGNSEEGKTTGAMPFLIDKYIEDHAEMHLILDFEGSNNENLARFYRSFGSSPIYYPEFKSARGPKLFQKYLLSR
jgi:hypothetical protein